MIRIQFNMTHPPAIRPIPGRTPLLFFSALIILHGWAFLCTAMAREAPEPPRVPPFFFENPGLLLSTQMPDDPYWEETVSRALGELDSANPEIRRSAVMLLGKYPVPLAQEAVVRALNDPAAPVRQAALVSLFETPRPITSDVAAKVIAMVGDPDTGIRRIASNLVVQVLQGFPFTLRPGDRQPRRSLPEEASKFLAKAFLDEDVSVRRNMVGHYPLLRMELPESTISRLLQDEDREVAVQALGWGLNQLGQAEFEAILPALLKREDTVFRMELARLLQGRQDDPAPAALRQLADDSDTSVALEARLGLFQQNPGPEAYRQMLALVEKARPRVETVNRVIMATQSLGPGGMDFLREWLDHSNPAFRLQATALFLSRLPRLEDEKETVLRLIDDDGPQVREQVMQAFLRRPAEIDPEFLTRIMESPHADVRRQAVRIAALLQPAERGRDLLLDLLLDAAVEVRLHALQAWGGRRLEGWEEIMGLSLRDEDPAIRQTALDWLLRSPEPSVLAVLKDYLMENPRSPLRPRIEIHLRRHDPTLM